MLKEGTSRKLLLENEVLKAQIILREHYVGTAVHEIYEVIGQRLSLVHFELGALALATETTPMSVLIKLSKDIQQSIRDLRTLAKYFFLQVPTPKRNGYIDSVNAITQTLGMAPLLSVTGRSKDLAEEAELLLTNLLLKIFVSIRDRESSVSKIHLGYHRRRLEIAVLYVGAKIDWTALFHSPEKNPGLLDMNFFLVLELTKAEFSAKSSRDHLNIITLKFPLTLPFYD